MNDMKTPFEIRRESWGSMTVTVTKCDDFRYSGGAWRCDAYTTDYHYGDFGKTQNSNREKEIKCGGCFQWEFVAKDHDESLIRPYRMPKKEKAVRGITVQKAAKEYVCRNCGEKIKKGDKYEKYSVRNAYAVGDILAHFHVGGRDKLREKYFCKPAEEIRFNEVEQAWKDGFLV